MALSLVRSRRCQACTVVAVPHARQKPTLLRELLVSVQAFFVATIFVLLSLPVSVYEIAMHLENFNRPKLQTRIIRILFMVPIYALDRCATFK